MIEIWQDQNNVFFLAEEMCCGKQRDAIPLASILFTGSSLPPFPHWTIVLFSSFHVLTNRSDRRESTWNEECVRVLFTNRRCRNLWFCSFHEIIGERARKTRSAPWFSDDSLHCRACCSAATAGWLCAWPRPLSRPQHHRLRLQLLHDTPSRTMSNMWVPSWYIWKQCGSNVPRGDQI